MAYEKSGTIGIHDKKTKRPAVMRTVFLRLSDYLPHHETTVTKDQKMPMFLPDFEKWVKLNGEVLTPRLSHTNGWILRSYLEREPHPYAHPDSHRRNYLIASMIEQETFLYKMRRKGQKNKTVYHLPVCRLKQDEITRCILIDFFQQMGVTSEFIETDYFQTVIPQVVQKLIYAEEVIRFVLECKHVLEVYPPNLVSEYTTSLDYLKKNVHEMVDNPRRRKVSEQALAKRWSRIAEIKSDIGMPPNVSLKVAYLGGLMFAEYLNKKIGGNCTHSTKASGEI